MQFTAHSNFTAQNPLTGAVLTLAEGQVFNMVPDACNGFTGWVDLPGGGDCPVQYADMLDVLGVSDDTVELWLASDDCQSVAGNPVEPDGWDSLGFPSWLVALGLA